MDVDVASLPDVPEVEVEESAHGRASPAALADQNAADSAAPAAEASRSCEAGGEGCAASGDEYVEEDMDADWVESLGDPTASLVTSTESRAARASKARS